MRKKHYKTIAFVLILSGFCSIANARIFQSKIDSIHIEFNQEQLVLPGESFEIGISSFHKKGKIRKTFGMEGGSVFWWKYKVDVTGGDFHSGKIVVNERLIPSTGKYLEVKVYPRKQPELLQKLLIPLNYETEISFIPTGHFDKAPGEIIEGALREKFNNGQSRILSKLYRNAESDHFVFSGDGGSWEKGKFRVDPDFLNIKNHTIHLFVQSARNPWVADTFTVLLDYRHNYRLTFNGSDGFSGFSGAGGSDGSMGFDGSEGSPGQHGEPGYNAPDVGIWSDLYLDPVLQCKLLYVFVENYSTGNEYRFLLNPDGGSLQVSVLGGDGGHGGSGGRGGDGGDGCPGQVWFEDKIVTKIEKRPFAVPVVKKVKKQKTDDKGIIIEYEEDQITTETIYKDVEVQETIQIKHVGPGGKGGNGGDGGPGGFGGPGGNGGNVFMYFTDDSRHLEHLFTINNQGGSGGMNGSGGSGGRGGNGGPGNPDGSNGIGGNRGWSAFGWAPDGWDGKIIIGTTNEFYIENSNEQLSRNEDKIQ